MTLKELCKDVLDKAENWEWDRISAVDASKLARACLVLMEGIEDVPPHEGDLSLCKYCAIIKKAEKVMDGEV